jgi:sulfite reductase (NADPH) flavoprotein alpha-component
VNVRVLYASETGNAEQLAYDLSTILAAHAVTTDPTRLNDISLAELDDDAVLLIVTSTTGEGGVPYDGEKFWETLSAESAPSLDGIKYSVLALGDTSYLDFCQAGKNIDARLEELGAERIHPIAMCDVDFEVPAGGWLSGVTQRLLDPDGLERDDAASMAVAKSAGARVADNDRRVSVPIVDVHRLTQEAAEKDVWSIRLAVDSSTIPYQPGDSVSVLPQNDPGTVDALLAALGLDQLSTETVALQQMLITDVELVTPSRELLEEVARRTTVAELRQLLGGTDRKALAAYLWDHDVVDLVQLASSNPFLPDELVALLRPIVRRSYSIATSPSASPDGIELTVAALRFHAHGRNRVGVSSTFLSDRRAVGDSVDIVLESNERFRLPADEIPIIMIGPGTGIAPFRAFLQERRERAAVGENWLFFGCRHRESDFLYRDEMEAFATSGVLTRLELAFSRDGVERVYVQDRMVEQGAELFAWLERGAVVYLCGDATRMARDVDAALVRIVSEHGSFTPDEATKYVDELSRAGRYLRDVY